MSNRENNTGTFSESENADRDKNVGRDDLSNYSAPQPTSQQLVTAQPVTAQPVTAQPVMAQPVTAQPVTAHPVAAQPVAAQPVMAQPVTAQPVMPQPIAAQQQAAVSLGAAQVVPLPPTVPPESGASLPSNGFVSEGKQTRVVQPLDWLALNKMKCFGFIFGLLLVVIYIFFVHQRIFGNLIATKTDEKNTSLDGQSTITAFCPNKTLESGNKVAGVYKGIDCGDFCYVTLTLDSGEDVFLLSDEEKWENYSGTPGNRVSVDYDLVQFWEEGGQYCQRIEFVTDVRSLAVGAAPGMGWPQEAVQANVAPDNLDRISRQDAIDQTVRMLQQIVIAEVALNVDSSSYVFTADGNSGPSGQPQDSVRAIEALVGYGFRPDPYVAFTILQLHRGDTAGFLAMAVHKKNGSPMYIYDSTDGEGIGAYNEYKRRNPNLNLDHVTLKTYIYENSKIRSNEEMNITSQ